MIMLIHLVRRPLVKIAIWFRLALAKNHIFERFACKFYFGKFCSYLKEYTLQVRG